MTERIKASSTKISFWRTALLLGLTYVIFNSLVVGIGLVVRGVTEEMLRPLVIVGILLGWILARNNFSAWWEFLGGGTLGFVLVIGRAGQLGQPLWRIIQSGGENLWGWIRWLQTREIPNPGALEFTWLEFSSQAGDILLSLWEWVIDLSGGLPSYSYLVSQVIWGMVIWILTLWFCWAMRRHYRPAWGFIPVAVLLSVLLTYVSGTGTFWMLLALGPGVALIGLRAFEEQEHKWTQMGISWPKSIWSNVVKIVLGITFVVITLAALTPPMSFNMITEPIRDWLWRNDDGNGPIQDMLGVEYNLEGSIPEVVEMRGLPRGHLIGSPPELSEEVVMVVRFPPGTPPMDELTPLAFYWRSLTFDRYTGFGWDSRVTVVEEFEPGEYIHTYPLEYYESMRQEIRLSAKLNRVLHTPGVLLSIDRDFLVYWRRTWEDQGSFKSLLRDDIFAATLDYSVYQVHAAIPAIDEETLRKVSLLPVVDEEALEDLSLLPSAEEALLEPSLNYPAWVKDRYLGLPEDLPKRVYDLAFELTADQLTAFDQAKAIETYLRTFPYTLELPAPPLNRDVADYFLFELQKGYCDYYTTAMAVLARAAGLPTRVVIGYAGGTYDPEEDRYLVTEAEAHTWPEIYFPEVGWIPFEPTTGKVDLVIEERALTVPPDLDKPAQTFGPQKKVDWSQLKGWGVPLAVLLLGGFGVWAIFGMDLWLLARGTPSQTMERIYTRLHRWSVRIGPHVPGAATPYEFEKILRERIDLLAPDSVQFEKQIPELGIISQIIKYYVKDHYQPILLTKEETGEVMGLWRRLRGRLWLARVIFIYRKIFRRITETRIYIWLRGIWSRLK